jgi:hypothetical protein
VKILDKKAGKKQKLILLGITRESLLVMEPETKAIIEFILSFKIAIQEITKTWPLTTLKRWAKGANKSIITLDFGDYEEEYVNIQSDDADSISTLIAGYIDIILKARKGTILMETLKIIESLFQ